MARVGNEGGMGIPGNAAVGGGLVSTVVTGSRTAAAGSGVQSITGAGFTPKAVIGMAIKDGAVFASWGVLDDASVEQCFSESTSATHVMGDTATLLFEISDGLGAIMQAVAILTSDGCDITWTKTGAGQDVKFWLLFLG